MTVLTKQVVLEPEAQAFADATSKPPFLFDLGPEKGRAAVDEVQSAPIDKLPVDIEDLIIEGGPSGQVSVRILRPQNAPATLPVIQYNHGAGWVFGAAVWVAGEGVAVWARAVAAKQKVKAREAINKRKMILRIRFIVSPLKVYHPACFA